VKNKHPISNVAGRNSTCRELLGRTVLGALAHLKIRHCFFSTNQAKVANCVSASASAQHIEAPINTNNNFADS
jgi:hypothetical protein